MRPPCFQRPAILVAAGAVLALAGCGTGTAAPSGSGTQSGSGTLSNSGRQPSASFLQKARVVSGRWSRSALARAWRTGLVLTGGEPLIQIPDNAGFDSGRQKDMFSSGHFRLATALPSGSPGDVIRWASGAALRVPVEDARAAFRVLATRTPCGGAYSCGQLGDLTVTGIQPATVALPTSRGLAQVPAWRFRLVQLPWTFTQVAVVPRALAVLPTNLEGPLAGLIDISADGRMLTLGVPAGGCSGYPPPRARAETYESASTVVVGTVLAAQPRPLPGQGCAGVGLIIKTLVRLRRPVGLRVVLDVRSGQPLPDPVQAG
jgi:hypothetical protein